MCGPVLSIGMGSMSTMAVSQGRAGPREMGIGPARPARCFREGRGEARTSTGCGVGQVPRASLPYALRYCSARLERHSHKTGPTLCRFSLTRQIPWFGEVHQTVL